LEYRGYDSAGICFDGEGSDVLIVKEVGNIAALKKKIDQVEKCKSEIECMNGSGIAHTRWATHGPPSALNSHPHRSDPNDEFVVVHNGMISNYREIKRFLETKGVKFESETDTECIAKLTKFWFDVEKGIDFRSLMKRVCRQLNGSFAILVKSNKHFPDELVAARNGSPLLVGIKSETQLKVSLEVELESPSGDEFTFPPSDKMESLAVNPTAGLKRSSSAASFGLIGGENNIPIEYFFSSDASAVVEHTKKIITLKDGDLAYVDHGDLSMHRFHHGGTKENREVEEVALQLAEIQKGGYEHFMIKEINEQSNSILDTMRGRLDEKKLNVHLGGLQNHLREIRQSRRVLFIACGTSFHSCLAVKSIFQELTEIPVSIDLATSFLDDNPPVHRDDVCVFVSQSGETKDTLMALEYCKAKKAICVGVTNSVGSQLSRDTDCGVHVVAGKEISVASTKAYTSQIIALILIAIQISQDNNRVAKRRNEVIAGLAKLPNLIQETLKMDKNIEKLVKEEYSNIDNLLLLGRGYQIATCLEGALKIKEITYVHAEGILAGELKHGPIALIEKSMPLIFLFPFDRHMGMADSALQQITARDGNPLVIYSKGTEPVGDRFDKLKTIEVPATDDALQPILNIIPLQLISYYLAIQRGINPDQPRNLAKAVVVA